MDVSVFIAGVCMQEKVSIFEIVFFFKVSMLFKKNKKKNLPCLILNLLNELRGE